MKKISSNPKYKRRRLRKALYKEKYLLELDKKQSLSKLLSRLKRKKSEGIKEGKMLKMKQRD